MPDNLNLDTGERRINEAVCIDTKRIFDSCVSKDCLEDLRVTFFSKSQRLIDEAVTVKTRDCCIEEVSIDVEEFLSTEDFTALILRFISSFVLIPMQHRAQLLRWLSALRDLIKNVFFSVLTAM